MYAGSGWSSLNRTKGTVYVIPNICQSGLTHNDPLEGTPQYLHFTTKNGDVRTFHFGSRASNPIDQWPDPDTYLHTSGDWTSAKVSPICIRPATGQARK